MAYLGGGAQWVLPGQSVVGGIARARSVSLPLNKKTRDRDRLPETGTFFAIDIIGEFSSRHSKLVLQTVARPARKPATVWEMR
jgi:hypothetical protein